MASIKKRVNKKGQVTYQASTYVGRDATGKQDFICNITIVYN